MIASFIARIAPAAVTIALLLSLASCGDDGTAPESRSPHNTWTIETGAIGLQSMSGLSGSDFYALGERMLLHWNGERAAYEFELRTDEFLTNIYSFPVEGVSYIVGHDGIVLRNDGNGWIRLETGLGEMIFTAVWGSDSRNVYAGGAWGQMAHFDGSQWLQMHTGSLATINDLCGFSPTDIYAACTGGALLHYAGDGWQETAIPETDYLIALWGSGPSDIYALGQTEVLHFDGSSWSTVDCGHDYFRAIGGTAPNDVYISTGLDTILHFDGASWSPLPESGLRMVEGIWAAGPADVYAANGAGRIRRWDGASWSPVVEALSNRLLDVWGSGPDDVWAVGESGAIMHRDASGWTVIRDARAPSTFGIWGRSTNDVYFCGPSGSLIHYDGVQWLPQAIGTNVDIHDVHGDPDGPDVYAVGAMGTILHDDGSGWRAEESGSTEVIAAVWRSPEGVVFACGWSGNLFRRSLGGAWTKTAGPFPGEILNDIWGVDSTNVLAVGTRGIVVRYDGASWKVIQWTPTVPAAPLNCVWGTSMDDYFVAGHNGLIYHYTSAKGWEQTAFGNRSWYGIWGTSARNVYAVGSSGTVLRYGPADE